MCCVLLSPSINGYDKSAPSINGYGKSGLSSMIFFPLVKPKLHQAHSGTDKLSRTASRQGSQKIYELTGQKGESGQNLVLE